MSFSLFTTTIEQILEDVSFALIETLVDTTLGTAVALLGQSTVAPGSMVGIYPGAYLLVDTGANQEQITVGAVTATTFTAYFTRSHSANALLVGATSQVDRQITRCSLKMRFLVTWAMYRTISF